jgi:hypothetical protein
MIATAQRLCAIVVRDNLLLINTVYTRLLLVEILSY